MAAPTPPAGRLLGSSFRVLMWPPYFTLLAVVLFVSFVSGYVGADDAAGFGATILLWLVLAYLHIAVILAAAAGAPDDTPAALAPEQGNPGSADLWIRAAFGRRCLVRYFVTDVVTMVLVAFGLLAFIVPGFIVGGIIALAPVAAVLEYQGPGGALRRSAELTRPARRTIGAVFGLCVLLPNIASASYFLGRGGALNDGVGIGLRILVALLSLVATFALTKAFLSLGGTVTPRSARPTTLRTGR